ncbi:unnamed protein product [Ceutorhynchus assimilis]|uniref:Atos-like conserved domain-containing protein n=1 Tax=Ceutorhynchus assimilis TaxID=467358 RepID=A0A9N9MKB4_9CUCU|nr:unnamed protein product [Ceutorhynchus assimilis]
MHSFNCHHTESGSSQDEGDLFAAVATLVTEGRIPGPSKGGDSKSKDFHEGPHCNFLTANDRTHICDSNNRLCARFKKNRDTILRQFKKRVPVCIEVLFTCVCKEFGNVETDDLDNAVLLEQWFFCTGSNKTNSTPLLNINQLINAVRSQLYFSQITAWLVTQDKSSLIAFENIRFRLSTSDELLAPVTFTLTATKHEFPLSDLGKGTTLNISFLSAARTSSRPTLNCLNCLNKKFGKLDPKMEILVDDRMHTSCTVKGKHCCEDTEEETVKICQKDNKHPQQRLSSRRNKKTKSNHHNNFESTTTTMAMQTEENHTTTANNWRNFNDLKTPPVVQQQQDKGRILLDAIERCSVQKQQNECRDNFCDMSESDKSFISRRENNTNFINSHCDRFKKLQDVSNISKAAGARRKLTFDSEDNESSTSTNNNNNNAIIRDIPIVQDQGKIRRNLGNTTSTVFHARTGLPLSSSPAPIRKGKNGFDFDSSLDTVSAIKSALFSSSFSAEEESESEGSIISPCSPEIYTGPKKDSGPVIYHRKGRPTNLLGTFEESVLNGRLEPVSTVHGFRAELGASGSFVPKHIFVPITAFFYAFGDHDRVSTPYLCHISLSKKGFNIPKAGTLQVTLFNPLGTVVKMFVLPYDLADMPPNSQTFIRQRTVFMPTECQNKSCAKWLRFLIHVRFMSSKSGKIYLHSDIRMIIMRKSDMDTATAHDIERNYELRSFTQMPTNPRFSPRK